MVFLKFIFPPARLYLLLIGLSWLILTQYAFAQKFVPPRKPAVAPLIGHTYNSDKDRDRIDDALFKRAGNARALRRSAVTAGERMRAQTELDGKVNVELIFRHQITQQQIDDFIASGGEIAYIYKTVSYGWNGRLPLGKVQETASLMGASLALIEEPKQAQLHMRIATQTGRVRPVWENGFAGSSGYDGDSTITIAIIDTGVDDSHTDLSGRNVYWKDFSSDGEISPRDIIQHGSHVAGIALGTGASLGTGTTLLYTDSGNLSGVPSGYFFPSVIDFPQVATSWTSTATWLGGGRTTLYHVYTPKGGSTWYGINSEKGSSGVSINTAFTPQSANAYSTALLSNARMSSYAVASLMTSYSAVGDGFNTLRGVAPGAQWAGAKVFTNSGSGVLSWTGAAIDDLVANRSAYNIKVMNLSLGAVGSPGIDTSTRQKVNNAAMNGIVPVISAGNDGPGNTSASEVDDPGRAAMALTVAAANDINELTEYTSSGFLSPDSTPGQEEDYKPDIMAPGGSDYYSNIMSVDSNDADGENASFADVQSNDYYNIKGTSMAAPFAAGAAALVIDALQTSGELSGVSWDFFSSNDVRRVKMLLCAAASESNSPREAGTGFNPSLQRASAGPDGYPAGKDRYEGYGMLNVDAAIEGGTVYYSVGSTENETLGGSDAARRVWARKMSLTAGAAVDLSLTVPASGDFDLYLYSFTPNTYGTPVILASSTNNGNGISEMINYMPAATEDVLLVVKKVSGQGQFTLASSSVTSTLDVTKSGTGAGLVTSVPAGIDCGADCSQDYAFGTIVTLTALPDTGSIFTGWSGDGDCSDGIVTIDANKTCTATFNLQSYSLNVTTAGTGTGTVTSSPLGIDCGTDCSHDYSYGTVVTLTATPDDESIFIDWSGNADCSDGVVTVDSAKMCTATFDLVQYELFTSVSPPSSGSVSPDCSAGCLYDSGTVVILSAVGNSGYFFDSWTNCDLASNNVCTETMDADDNLTANFQPCYQPVRILSAEPLYFDTLQAAYDAAIDGDIVQVRDVVFSVSDNVNADRSISVTFAGGYNCNYSAVTGVTVFNGIMTVSDGTVIIGDFIFGN